MRFCVCFFFCFMAYGLLAQKMMYPVLSLDARSVQNANAVIRLDETTIDLSSPKNLRRSHRRIVTVLNRKGYDYLDLQVYYDKKISIKNLGAVVYDAFGKEVKKFKSGDFKDVAAVSSFSLYEDSRVKYLNYTPVQYPYTIEFFYEINTPNTAWIPFWRPMKGYNISTEKSTYDVIYDAYLGLNKKDKNFSGHNITDRSTSGRLSMMAENLEAIHPEELGPDFAELGPMLMVAPKEFYYEGYTGKADDWEGLGQWMYDNLIVDRTGLSEETKHMVRGLVHGIDDPIEKAKIIYSYVQDHTRYISVQVGIGGIRPISASEVDRVKYGDCKGLTNYTKALLEVVGVTSYYTGVYAQAGRQKGIDRDFPSLFGQINHVILNIPIEDGEPVWLECTDQTLPFGFLGDFTDDREVLSITPEGGRVIRTPKYTVSENSRVTRAVFGVLADRGLVASAEIVSKGLRYDNKFHLEREEKREQDKHYKGQWGHIGNLGIKTITLQNDKENVVFTEQVNFGAADFAEVSGGLLMFSPNVLSRDVTVPNLYRNRKLPLKIEKGFTDEDYFEIDLPEGFEIEFLPGNISIENNFGKYRAEIESISDTRLMYRRTFMVKEGLYAKEAYSAYRDFIKEVSINDQAKIVLAKK